MPILRIPEYLCAKKLPDHTSSLISQLSSKYGWTTYGEITEDALRMVHALDFVHFWMLIKILSFQGFIFEGKLNRYAFPSASIDGKQASGFVVVMGRNTEDTPLDYNGNYAFLKLRLQPYGVYSKADLHLVPLNHIVIRDLELDWPAFLQKEGFAVVPRETLTAVGMQTEPVTVQDDHAITYYVDEDCAFSVSPAVRDTPLDFDIFSSTLRLVRVLRSKGYETLGDIPLDVSFMLDIPSVGKRVIEKFFASVSGERSTGEKISRESAAPRTFVFTGPTVATDGYYVCNEDRIYVPHALQTLALMDAGGPSDKIAQVFKRHHMSTFGDLPVDYQHFLRENGILNRDIRKFDLYLFNRFPSEFLRAAFVRMLEAFARDVPLGDIADRDWKMIVLRANGSTLEEIASFVDVTRERVRQVINKRAAPLFARYTRLFEEWAERLQRAPFLHIGDLLEMDCTNIARGITLMESLKLPASIHVDGSWVHSTEKVTFRESLDVYYASLFVDRDADSLYSRAEVDEYVKEFFSVDNVDAVLYARDMFVKETFVQDGDYFRNRRHKLSKADMCVLVFEREFAHGHHVYKQFPAFRVKLEHAFPGVFEGDSDRSIISNLLRQEDQVLLWGIGFFRHVSSLHPGLSAKVLLPVKEWLAGQFTEDVTQVSALAGLKKFAAHLKPYEIDNEHALYSVLRMYFPDAFNYSRSPNLVRKGYKRRGKTQLVIDFVQNAGGYVSAEDMEQHFYQKLGWKPYMLDQAISLAESIMSARGQRFVHIDALDLDDQLLEDVRKHAHRKLSEVQGSYSVEAIFDDCQSTMMLMNILDGKVLYQVLEKLFPLDFDYPHYPHIAERGLFDNENATLAGQFETYVLEYGDYVLREELHEEFRERRKWNLSSYYSVFASTRDKVVELYPDEFIHVDTLGWTPQKQRDLEAAILSYWRAEYNQFVYLTLDKHLFADDFLAGLPSLEVLYEWTVQLLISFIGMMESVRLLGMKKRVVIRTDNAVGVDRDVDLVAYILRTEFGGAAKVGDIHRKLASIGLCAAGKMPETYLSAGDRMLPYQHVGDELILNELMVTK